MLRRVAITAVGRCSRTSAASRWRSCSSPPWAPPACVTGWLTDLGFNLYTDGFTLFTFAGVLLVYMYFQIPLMVLVILPALEGLRPAWREAAENMGARTWQYWRYVGGPVLRRRSSAACCCCSAARSPPTPPPRP